MLSTEYEKKKILERNDNKPLTDNELETRDIIDFSACVWRNKYFLIEALIIFLAACFQLKIGYGSERNARG
jgi:hypothetical protein